MDPWSQLFSLLLNSQVGASNKFTAQHKRSFIEASNKLGKLVLVGEVGEVAAMKKLILQLPYLLE